MGNRSVSCLCCVKAPTGNTLRGEGVDSFDSDSALKIM